MPDGEPAQQELLMVSCFVGLMAGTIALLLLKANHLNCLQHGFPGPGPNVLL